MVLSARAAQAYLAKFFLDNPAKVSGRDGRDADYG